MKNREVRIIQIGNYVKRKSFRNPQNGRVYSVHGLAPTRNTCGGGADTTKSNNLWQKS